MRIGVITYWSASGNYGQLLQCYALQKYLRLRGHDAFLIRYYPKHHPATTLPGRIRRILRTPSLLLRLGSFLMRKVFPTPPQDLKKFDEFRAKYLKKTNNYYESKAALADSEIEADMYICGSDVIWSPVGFQLNEDGAVYFLNFGSPAAKRVAYAASFGSDTIPQKVKNFIAPLLANLDAIGVREESGLQICKACGITNARVVVDPTLLLDKQTYLDMIPSPPHHQKYMFFYFIEGTMDIPWDDIVAFSGQMNWQCKMAAPPNISKNDAVELIFPEIPVWLHCINDAECVFTNSFHGIVFAVLMHRPFLCVLREKTDVLMPLNDRLVSFLTRLGLASRVYSRTRGTFSSQMMQPIDWEAVDNKRSAFQEQSEYFLKEQGV